MDLLETDGQDDQLLLDILTQTENYLKQTKQEGTVNSVMANVQQNTVNRPIPVVPRMYFPNSNVTINCNFSKQSDRKTKYYQNKVIYVRDIVENLQSIYNVRTLTKTLLSLRILMASFFSKAIKIVENLFNTPNIPCICGENTSEPTALWWIHTPHPPRCKYSYIHLKNK